MTRLGLISACIIGCCALFSRQVDAGKPEQTDYELLLRSNDPKAVTRAVTPWLSERRRTSELVAAKLGDMGDKFGIKGFMKYDDLFGPHVNAADLKGEAIGGGLDFHILVISPEHLADIITRLKADTPPRKRYVEAMRRLERQDLTLRDTKEPSPAALIAWAKTRSTFDDDLKVKKVAMKAAANQPLVFEVTVRTVDTLSGKEQPNYEVWGVVRGWDGVESEYVEFPKVSSPSTHSLEAGRWFIWCRKKAAGGGYVKGERKTVDISSSMTVDVAIPQ
jgi:hypothetical protein